VAPALVGDRSECVNLQPELGFSPTAHFHPLGQEGSVGCITSLPVMVWPYCVPAVLQLDTEALHVSQESPAGGGCYLGDR
jgi:hypothetical protein